MTRSERLIAGVLGAMFIALHLPFLPPTLEDLDSINFALGIRQYDVSQHQPHPPGYPLYILVAKLLHAVGLSEVHALSLIGVVAGGLALLALMKLFAALEPERRDSPFTWLAVLVVAASPLFWFTAARPLSDMTGLAASLGVQALLASASGAAAVIVGAFLAAFAAGIRSQVVWLTLPMVVLAVWRLQRTERLGTAVRAFMAYAAGGLAWFVPLVIVSGGPAAYLKVFYSQGAEDLSGVAMLATTPTPRQALLAFQYHFIGPWGEWPIAAAVLVLATAGFVVVALRDRRALVTLLAGFGPYLVFDLLFQETITTRYALPLVIPLGYLAVRGASLAPRPLAVAAGLAIVASVAWVSDRAMFGFHAMEAPAFRMLGDMYVASHPEGAALPTTPVLAMHRREYFDLRRPFQWVGDRLPQFAQRLSTPPKHEWLEVVKYWNAGGREPVWFIADPPRSDLALFKYHRRPVLYRWPFTPTILLGGARPNEMDWHVIEQPDWYLGEGWALTPETAGTAREDGKGPGYAPISGWIRRYAQPATLMVGGRNLADAGPNATLRVRVDGQLVLDDVVAPGFFLRFIPLASTGASGDYAQVTIESDNRQLAIEQFDAQPTGRVIYGFGNGWNEQEYNPRTGALWRWSTDRSAIRVRAEGHALALTLRGEIEEASTSHVSVKAGSATVAAFDVDRTFTKTVLIPQALLTQPETELTIESSHYYVPAEKKWRSQDRRKLGLKLYECSLTPVS
ncbi:MAG: hypothetical protein JSU08_04590 [Acidobacteria bacterium]|nr:hypothetical protein [Acidobacteriota bacterium]